MGFFALFYLGHLAVFIINGPVTVGEANKVVAWGEIIALVTVMALAINCFLGEISKKKPKQ